MKTLTVSVKTSTEVLDGFGGALNLNVHFHSVYTDGVFYENERGEEIFKEYIPSHEDVVTLTKKR